MKSINCFVVRAAIVAALGLLASPVFASSALILDGRCDDWGDSLAQGEPVNKRISFALACEKSAKVISQIKLAAKGLGRKGSDVVTTGYPTYGYFDPASGEAGSFTNPQKWFAPPTTSNSSCDAIPPAYEVAYFCASGCYTPEQGILLPNGEMEIERAHALEAKSIMAVKKGSFLASPAIHEMGLAKVMTEVKADQSVEKEILHFHTAKGGSLRVTLNHPLVNQQGEMWPASQFVANRDSLVRQDGSLDLIVSIAKEKTAGKVYNVLVDSADRDDQIVIAQGFLNGSVYFQNESVKDLNRRMLRVNVTKHLLQ